MTSSNFSSQPTTPNCDLGDVLSSIGVGMETLREPLRLTAFEHWVGHIPFAFWLIRTLRPRTLVELGTHRGNSYLAFCQAIEAEACGTRAYAVDTWEGDIHMSREDSLFAELSAYHDPRYAHFSSLVASTFAEARGMFSDGSIDILHIDGTHTYEAAKDDFLTWKSCLSESSVVLFHDTNVKRSQYGVWKLWEELAQEYPHFEFYHSYGLGALGTGTKFPKFLERLFEIEREPESAIIVRSYFATRGDASVKRLIGELRIEQNAREISQQSAVIDQLNASIAEARVDVSSSRDECSRLRQDINGRIAHVAELERHITAQHEKTIQQVALSDFLKSTIDELRHNLSESQDFLRQTQAALEESERKSDAAMAISKTKLDQAEERISAHKRSLESTQILIQDAEARLSAITHLGAKVLAARDRQIQALQTIRDDSAENIQNLTMINDLMQSIATSHQMQSGLSTKLARLQKAVVRRSARLFQRSFNRIDKMPPGLFDREYYLASNPDVVASGEDAERHFSSVGWKEGRRPHPAFDTSFYISQDASLQAAGINPLRHYADFGLLEGRSTLRSKLSRYENTIEDAGDEYINSELRQKVKEIRNTGLFDDKYYLEHNPDVAKTGENPLVHFARLGCDEGRRPNAYFDPIFYIAQNPDLIESDMNPLVHYSTHGLAEGRQTFAMGSFNDGAHAALSRKLFEAEYLSTLKTRDIDRMSVASWPIVMPDMFHLRDFKPTHRIAVVVHVYYPDLWAEMTDAISNVPEPFDLFVSLVDGKSDHLFKSITKQFPNAQCLIFPNRGRDILSFLTFASLGILTQYELVCKLHTKKSPHREDGDDWRQNLISMILPEREKTATIIAAFDADPDLGLVVADGELNTQGYAWLNNVDQLVDLMPDMGRKLSDVVKLPFAGGSIFWIRPFILNDLIGLKIAPDRFECEPIGTDGTIAHAIERLFSIACHSAGMRIKVSSEIMGISEPPASEPLPSHEVLPHQRVVAFYLPQFHPIQENDRWWGKGFTEWTNVTKAEPLFLHHRQPRLPGELGFTDLRVAETRESQADLARAHGISAFCYYFYWFGENKLLLDRPLKEVLSTGEPDFPFMICWANEPWSRNWDGANKEILVPQLYEEGWVDAFAREIAPILKDSRYLHLDSASGRPIVAIYRIMHIPNPTESTRALRTALKKLQVGEVHLTAAWLNFDDDDPMPPRPSDVGLDSYFEFPPHHLHLSIPNVPGRTALVPDEMKPTLMRGNLYDYASMVDLELAEAGDDPSQEERHRGVMMGWDNTARRGTAATVFRGATPGHFRRWLRGVVQQNAKCPSNSGEKLIFVNAWNEWAEGTCLEPDRDFGRGWLEAVRSALLHPK